MCRRSAPCPASSAGLDTKVEIILAAAILSLIVLLFTWSVQQLQYLQPAVQCMQYSVSSSPGQSQQTWSPAHNLSPLSGAQSIFHIWCRECSQQSLENMATFVNLSSSSISLDQNLNIVQIYQINIWHDLQVCPPHIRISSNIPFALKSGVCQTWSNNILTKRR